MKKTIVNVFKGLTPQYYFRQLFFGALIFGFMIFMLSKGDKPIGDHFGLFVVYAINTLLYPYSRFAYERVVGFIMGDNLFFVNAFLMLFVKFMTMFLCWGFAIFIAPIGFLFIYFYQKKS